jgi:hypothetical protein
MPILLVVFALSFILILTVLAIVQRILRERQRVELQRAILERVGSVKDFAEFLTTEQGERFLASLAPAQFSTHHRTLWSVRIGVVLLTVGVLLMFGLHSSLFGAVANERPTPLLLGILLLIAVGVGMLLSAVVALVVARTLGVDRRDGRSS